jgi:ankyrin repeat protein
MNWRRTKDEENEANIFINNLLKQKIEINKCNIHTLWTALHWASFHGDLDTVIELLNNGASPALPDQNGCFPMDLAGNFGHDEIAKLLINKSLELIDDYSDKFKRRLSTSTKDSDIKKWQAGLEV